MAVDLPLARGEEAEERGERREGSEESERR